MRTLLSDPRAFAVEASAVELCWVFGPPLALGAGSLFSTGAALVGAGAVLLAGTLAFAAHPASRAWRPTTSRVDGEARSTGSQGRGALGSPALRSLVLVMGAVGAIFGATEIGVTTAAGALGNTAAAGPLLGVWGMGSLLGGVWLARRGGVAPLVPLLVALAVGHTALAGAAVNVFALAVGLLLAGAAIAPSYAVVYSLVERAAPAGTVTEAFAWLATAVSVGAALGAALAGSVADAFGPSAVFVIAGAAGALALAAGLDPRRSRSGRRVRVVGTVAPITRAEGGPWRGMVWRSVARAVAGRGMVWRSVAQTVAGRGTACAGGGGAWHSVLRAVAGRSAARAWRRASGAAIRWRACLKTS